MSKPYSRGLFSATIYGDEAIRVRYAEVLLRYPRLFIDDGKTVDIPKEE